MTVGELDTITPMRYNIDVLVPLSDVTLEGYLSVPRQSTGIVLFAHGSSSSRYSPRNQYVAEQLYKRGISTLLIDLLTPSEERMETDARHLRFDTDLLSERLSDITKWIEQHEKIGTLPLGLFGSATGAAAALTVAALRPDIVQAVVLRGGRPDMAEEFLEQVEAPTLLIAGGKDSGTLQHNRQALERMNDSCCLEVIPEASHLFTEPGTLKRVATLAGGWFDRHFERAT